MKAEYTSRNIIISYPKLTVVQMKESSVKILLSCIETLGRGSIFHACSYYSNTLALDNCCFKFYLTALYQELC